MKPTTPSVRAEEASLFVQQSAVAKNQHQLPEIYQHQKAALEKELNYLPHIRVIDQAKRNHFPLIF